MLKVPPCRTCEQPFGVRDRVSERSKSHAYSHVPLVLDCGHSFCEHCITKLAAITKTQIKCSSCQQVTMLKEGYSLRSILPINAYIVGQTMLNKQLTFDDSVLKMVPAMMKSPNPGIQAKKTKLPKQEPCCECSLNAATCRCYKCDCVLCGSCFDKVHQASKMLRKHQAIPLYESDKYEQIKSVCPDHDNRPIEYFCEDDQMAICSHCVIVGVHQNHAINSIEEKNKEAVKKIEPAISEAQTVLSFLKRSDKKLHGILPQLQMGVRQVIDDIREHFLFLHSTLIAREKALIHSIEKICLEEVAPVDELKLKVSEDLQKVTSIVRDAGNLKQNLTKNFLNVQAILDKLNNVKDIPCFVQHETSLDSSIRCCFDDEALINTIQTYGKLHSSNPPRVKLLPLHQVADDILETASLSSDKESSITGTDQSNDRIDVDKAEVEFQSETMSQTSDVSSVGNDFIFGNKNLIGLKQCHINHSCQEAVYVSHIKNPSHFMVQKLAIQGDLKVMSKQIKQHCNRPDNTRDIPLTNLAPDWIVLAQFTGDNTWYRARVLSFEVNEEDFLSSQVEVIYVDYGNSEIIPLARVRTMPKKFARYPAIAMKCSLYDVVPTTETGEWSVEAIRAFVAMIDDKPMQCLVKEDRDGIQYVDLSKPAEEKIEGDQPVSMRDALVFLEHAYYKTTENTPMFPRGPYPHSHKQQYLKPFRPKPGESFTCIVSHVNQPDDFFIQQLGEEAQYLSSMMEDLQEMYNSQSSELWSVFCPYQGMLCVAQYTADDRWYRAFVVALPGHRSVEVLYVDYGNTETIPFWRIKKISNKFLVLPTQALACKLVDVEPIDKIKGWQEEAAFIIRNLVFKQLMARVAAVVDAHLLVQLYDTDSGHDICVNSALVQHGYARSTGPASAVVELQVIPEKLVSSSPPSKLESPLNLMEAAQTWKPMRSSPVTVTRRAESPAMSSKSVTSTSSSSVTDRTRDSKSASPLTTGADKIQKKKTKSKAGEEKAPYPEVVVSEVVSPSQIYIQPVSAEPKLHLLMQNLQASYRGTDVEEEPMWSKGDACVALRPEDIRWYRAKIERLEEDKVTVFLYDYGFTEVVERRHLRNLDKGFETESAYCLQCHFPDVTPAGDIRRWSQTAKETLMEMVKGKTCYIIQKGKIVKIDNQESLPIDLLQTEYIIGDALNPDKFVYNSVTEKLLSKGLALPVRRTAGILVAVEQAKASTVTIPPKPLVPEEQQTKTQPHVIHETLTNTQHDAPPEVITDVASQDDDNNQLRDISPRPRTQDLTEKEQTEKEQIIEPEKTQIAPLPASEESPEEIDQIDSVLPADVHRQMSQRASQEKKTTESNPLGDNHDNSPEFNNDKVSSREAVEEGNLSSANSEPSPPNKRHVIDEEVPSSTATASKESAIDPPSVSVTDNANNCANIDEGIAEEQRDEDSTKTSTMTNTTEGETIEFVSQINKLKKSKGCSIYDKLQAQSKAKQVKTANAVKSSCDTDKASEANVDEQLKSPIRKSVAWRDQQSEGAKRSTITDEALLEDCIRVSLGQGQKLRYKDPDVPVTGKMNVVPTYVDYAGTIYCHAVYDNESPNGRFGFILKEKTLETILQDAYLSEQGLYRACIPRDGNCMFRAFAQAVYNDQGKQHELRQAAVSAMRKNWEAMVQSVGEEDKETYLLTMEQSGTYGGEPEIQVLCTILHVKAVVHLGGLNYNVQKRTYGKTGGTINLIYISDGNYDGGHYDLAVKSQDQADLINEIYAKWREIRIKQLCSYSAYEDNTVYDESLLAQLMDHLQKCHIKTEPDFEATFYPGRPVVCRYSSDGLFYRAVVEEVHDDSVKVLYVDFGNSERAEPENLRTTAIMEDIPIQCYKCVLHDVVPVAPVAGEPLQVSLMTDTGRNLSDHLIELGLAIHKSSNLETLNFNQCLEDSDDDNIMDELGEPTNISWTMETGYLPMWKPSPGTVINVVVTNVDSPSEVYVQRMLVNPADEESVKINQDLHSLEIITQELQTQAEFYPKLSPIKPGMACCALYSVDERWYRGEVLFMHSDGPTPMVVVLFVDYGNKELVSPDNVRALPEDMIVLEAQASCCKLAGVVPPQGVTEWPQETTDLFTALIVSKALTAVVKSVDEHIYISLYDHEEFFKECYEEKTELLVYYPLMKQGLLQIHNVTDQGVVIEADAPVENFA